MSGILCLPVTLLACLAPTTVLIICALQIVTCTERQQTMAGKFMHVSLILSNKRQVFIHAAHLRTIAPSLHCSVLSLPLMTTTSQDSWFECPVGRQVGSCLAVCLVDHWLPIQSSFRPCQSRAGSPREKNGAKLLETLELPGSC